MYTDVWTYDIFLNDIFSNGYWKPLDDDFKIPYKRKRNFVNIRKLSYEDRKCYEKYPWTIHDRKNDDDFYEYIRDNRTGRIFHVNIYDLYIYASESVILKRKLKKEKKKRQKSIGYKPGSYSYPAHSYVKTVKTFNEDIKEINSEGFNVRFIIKPDRKKADIWDWKFKFTGKSWKDQKKIKRRYLKKGEKLFNKKYYDIPEDPWEEYLN